MKTIKWFTFTFLVVLLSCGSDSDTPKDCVDRSSKIEGECSKIYAPVCGCNGITYSNNCMARLEGVQRWSEGECK
jgi:hypothetical protein